MPGQHLGTIIGLAVRTSKRGPMEVRESAAAVADGGIIGDLKSSVERGITLLSARQWSEVLAELGVDLPWHTRRANVLVDCAGLSRLIGRTVSIGRARLRIINETAPCGLMDELYPGLRAALSPECRGGVYGRVLADGAFAIGTPVELEA